MQSFEHAQSFEHLIACVIGGVLVFGWYIACNDFFTVIAFEGQGLHGNQIDHGRQNRHLHP